MAQASQPDAECAICSEQVCSMKILPCDHRFCLSCLSQISHGQPSIICPNCQKDHTVSFIEKLPTVYFGQLKCGICQENWGCDKCYWCPFCVQIICALCHVDKHSSKLHQVYKWNSLQGVKDCYNHSLQMDILAKETSPEGIKKIHDMCENIEKVLIQKLKQMAPLSLSKVPFHEYLDQLFGQLDISHSNPLISNVDRLDGISREIMSLATGGDPLELPEHTLSHPRPTRMTVDRFTESAESLATIVWSKVKLKEEPLAVTVPSAASPKLQGSQSNPPSQKPEDMVINGRFVCSVPFLASVSEDCILPEAVPNFRCWVYDGNGTHFQKFVAVVQKNNKRPAKVVIDCAAEFLPTKTQGSAVFEEITVWTRHQMTEQSQNNLLSFLCLLLSQVPKASHVGLNTYGKVHEKLEDLWRHLPASVTRIGVFMVPLTQRGINMIAEKMAETIEMSYDCRSWKSMLRLVSEIIHRKGRPDWELRIRDFIGDAVIFGKFMKEVKQFKERSLLLHLYDFSLTEAHAKQLLKTLGTVNGLNSLKLERIQVHDSDMKKIRTACGTRSIGIKQF